MKQLIPLKTKSNIIADEGIVTIAVNAFGNIDFQGDISMPGSYTKTLNENFKRVKHFRNHDPNQLVGCPIEGKEEGGYLVFKSAMSMGTEIGRDTFENYKLYNKYGLTLEHSVGVQDIKRDATDKRKVLEWMLWEFSSLYGWGANADTPLLDLKSLNFQHDPKKAIPFIHDALKMKFSDATLIQYENYLDLISKALAGDSQIVECSCGLKFDYHSVNEHTLQDEVKNLYSRYVNWMVQDIVHEEVQKIEPELRTQIQDIINSKKSIDAFENYVYCPKCYKKHFKSEIIEIETSKSKGIVKPSNDTSHDDSRQNGTITFKSVNDLLAAQS